MLSAVIARLLGQRRILEYERERRGAAASPIAIAANIARKAASRIRASVGSIVMSQSFK